MPGDLAEAAAPRLAPQGASAPRPAPDASLAAAVFQAVFEGMSLSFGLLFWWGIRHEHLKVALTPPGARAALIRFGIGNVAYVLAIGVAFLSAPASLLISALVAIYYMFEQTPSRGPGVPAGGDEAGQA